MMKMMEYKNMQAYGDFSGLYVNSNVTLYAENINTFFLLAQVS